MAGQPSIAGLLTIDNTPVIQTDVAGQPSDLVIDRADGVILTTNIRLGGLFRGAFTGKPYTVSFFAESLGPGGNALLAAVPGVVPGALPLNPTDVPVSSPVVSGAALPADGLYRLTCVTTIPSIPATAFAEGPIIQITT